MKLKSHMTKYDLIILAENVFILLGFAIFVALAAIAIRAFV